MKVYDQSERIVIVARLVFDSKGSSSILCCLFSDRNDAFYVVHCDMKYEDGGRFYPTLVDNTMARCPLCVFYTIHRHVLLSGNEVLASPERL